MKLEDSNPHILSGPRRSPSEIELEQAYAKERAEEKKCCRRFCYAWICLILFSATIVLIIVLSIHLIKNA